MFIKCLIYEVSEILRILLTEFCRMSLQNMQGVKINFSFQITSLFVTVVL